MTSLSPPPIPSDVSLRDFAFMPLEVERLRRSRAWLYAKRKPEIGFYMLNLWATSWHEVPAGSLEDDDDVLADAAMCTQKRWPGVREGALHGWVKCADGRLYHSVVTEKVIDAWRRCLREKYRREGDRVKKAKWRAKDAGEDPASVPACPPFRDWLRDIYPATYAVGRTIFPEEKTLKLSPGTSLPVPRDKLNCPPGQSPLSKWTKDGVRAEKRDLVQSKEGDDGDLMQSKVIDDEDLVPTTITNDDTASEKKI